jgi:hypothetical protein
MLAFKHRREANGSSLNFTDFLREEWPDDFAVYMRARRGDPSCHRSYESWQLKFDVIVPQ